ncbi:hypothetical protein QJS10_CPB15g00651 [Acorus calamus]|uniref:Uncharacterized protein n=1 Tax=Acorus calamus TaxID=4465 RepID=A0AAV9D7L8_ACOCL|nr:hypothetical protein QJS10_CPB15g00651 [Acorus calamus]
MVDSIDRRSTPMEENSTLLAKLEAVEERTERLEALQKCVGELEYQVEALQEMLTKIQAMRECAAELEPQNHSYKKVFFFVIMLFTVFVGAKLSGS